MTVIIEIVQRLTSRGFLTAAAAYSIVMVSGLGLAHFEDGVVLAATGALVTYIGVKGGSDVATTIKKK